MNQMKTRSYTNIFFCKSINSKAFFHAFVLGRVCSFSFLLFETILSIFSLTNYKQQGKSFVMSIGWIRWKQAKFQFYVNNHQLNTCYSFVVSSFSEFRDFNLFDYDILSTYQAIIYIIEYVSCMEIWYTGRCNFFSSSA